MATIFHIEPLGSPAYEAEQLAGHCLQVFGPTRVFVTTGLNLGYQNN